MFDYDNGPQFNEIFFAIPYDENYLAVFRPTRYFWGYEQSVAWGYNFSTSACDRVLPSFYDLYENDENDFSISQFLRDLQYVPEGTMDAPMLVNASRYDIDNTYSGADKEDKIDYQIRYSKDIVFRNITNWDTGDDISGRNQGYRCNKFHPSKSQVRREQSNDFPVFRYADVLLMKAEAILRGGIATNGQTPLMLVNRIRERAGAAIWSSVDLPKILDERGRELDFECWRRIDLIRFGKYEDPWFVKTDNDPNRRLFPIPKSEIEANPLLIQNFGY